LGKVTSQEDPRSMELGNGEKQIMWNGKPKEIRK
jgi:hypothetical protein